MILTRWNRPDGVGLRLLLIRHGTPEDSSRGRCYGSLDVGLSDAGCAEMTAVAEALASTPVDAVYTSPRRRARESAEILTSEIVVDRRLSEIDFGEIEGLTYDEVAERFPHLYRRWMETPTEVKFPGGESFAEMRERVLDAVAEIRKTHVEQTVAIVAHGGVNRIVLAEALAIEPRHIFRIAQSYTGVSIVDEFDGYSVVQLMNGSC